MDTTSIATTVRFGPNRGAPPGETKRRLSRRARNTLLTAHIALSVGPLGDSAGYLAVAIRASKIDDEPARAREAARDPEPCSASCSASR